MTYTHTIHLTNGEHLTRRGEYDLTKRLRDVEDWTVGTLHLENADDRVIIPMANIVSITSRQDDRPLRR